MRGGGGTREAQGTPVITAADLDKAAPDHPVYLTHTTGHYGVANSLALAFRRHARDQDPPGGTIDRDKDGHPTGVMKERATGLIRTGGGAGGGGRGNMRENVLRIIEGFNREGMTGAKDLNVNEAKWDLYKQLLDEESSPFGSRALARRFLDRVRTPGQGVDRKAAPSSCHARRWSAGERRCEAATSTAAAARGPPGCTTTGTRT